jgi:hypothetical protein
VHDRTDPPFERPFQNRPFRDVALHDIDGRIRMGVQVDDSNARARVRKRRYYMTADEPGAPGDQDPLPAWSVGAHRAAAVSVVTGR